MQSQEGSPQEQASSDEQRINPDPREQQQAPQRQQAYEERPYEERLYTEGYASLDTGQAWDRPGEKIYPRSAGQRGIEGPLLFIVLLCALAAAGIIFGFVIAWLSWLLLAALVAAGIVIIAMNWRVVTVPLPIQTFQVLDHPQLIIRDSAGSISVRRGADNVVTVAATKRASGIGMTPENMRVDYAFQDNTLSVSAHQTWGPLQFGIRHIDLVITVPEGCDIQVNNGSGKIVVQGVSGRIDLRTGSGSIEMGELRGQIALKTGSGSISGVEIQGQIALKTGSGNIELEQATMQGNSCIKTGSGSINVVGALDPHGSYEMVTGSGTVHLTLPSYSSFRLNASTGSGGVLNDFGNVESGAQPRAQLRIKTGSGTIHVHRGDS
jgi:hypothetical protein